MNNKIIALVALIVVIVMGWFLYDRSDSGMSIDLAGGTVPAAGENINGGETPNTGNSTVDTEIPGTVKEFTVTGGNMYFSPKNMTVNRGDTVKINFVNAVGMHDWRLDEFNAKTPVIQAGQTASVTFVADKTGTFEYYCSVGQHRQAGMVGTLTVE